MNLLKKSGISFLLIFTLLISTLAFTVSASNSFAGTVTGDCVNVRIAPGLNSAVAYTLNKGASVTVYEKAGDWYKIGTPSGGYAYIYATYVSQASEPLPSREGSTGGAQAVEIAKQYLGIPYVYGGTSPSGFDCSGLVYYVYKQLGYSLNRTAHGMLSNGVAVDKANLMPGDIVMFMRSGSSYVHHVGIYVGDGMMIHSPQTGDVIKYTSIVTGYYNDCYYTARRIIR